MVLSLTVEKSFEVDAVTTADQLICITLN